MIAKIRILLEYQTFPVWLYDNNDCIIDTALPSEWEGDKELEDAFWAVSNLYDTFFIDTDKEFSYVGCPNKETKQKLKELLSIALDILLKKNKDKYTIQNDVYLESLCS